ncbi:MAG: nucleotidyltransferase family protein [Gemmatimonadaceae bacterium]
MIAGLLLAAGRSTRFGGDKLLALVHGAPVLSWSAAALAAEVDALFIVVPPDSASQLMAVAGVAAVTVENASRDDGLASSIRAGLAVLPTHVEAVVIALADQPFVSPGTVRRLRERWSAGGVEAVAPRYRDARGHPVLFGRSTFPALQALEGDEGAKALLESLGKGLGLVDVDEAMPSDVDTPHALSELDARRRREDSDGAS